MSKAARKGSVPTTRSILDVDPTGPTTGVEQAVVTATTASTEVQQSTKPESIRAFSERQIRAGLGYQEVLELVLKAYPKAATTIACIRWYAAQMRKAGEVVAPRPKTGRPREKFLLTAEELAMIEAKFDGEITADINAMLDKLRELAPPAPVADEPEMAEAA